MGNMHCPAEDVAYLAAVARDFCPFPEYSLNPLFINMLSDNSSLHLNEHYSAVQASLTPQQQQAFTQTLRSTFGREGKVSYGGVGVVALSLAFLFDSVAKQVKGQYVSDQEPIPGLFLKDPRGYYAPEVYTVSRYLRLVPYIANNPSRMRQETRKYLRELRAAVHQADINSTVPVDEEITEANRWRCYIVGMIMKVHLELITNKGAKSIDETSPYRMFILNINCDKEANQAFLNELDYFDDRTQEAFRTCRPDSFVHAYKSPVENIAIMNFIDIVTWSLYTPVHEYRVNVRRKEHFDLKVNALGKWN